jgi:hypothetical protein
LVHRRNRRQHKCSRIKKHPVCTAGSSSTVQGLDPAYIFGQYDSSKICEQDRRNIVRDSPRASDSNSNNIQQLQRTIDLSPHSWNSEYNDRSPQQKEGISVRVGVIMEVVQLSKKAMGVQQVQDRCVCSEAEQEAASVL